MSIKAYFLQSFKQNFLIILDILTKNKREVSSRHKNDGRKISKQMVHTYDSKSAVVTARYFNVIVIINNTKENLKNSILSYMFYYFCVII